MKNFLRFLSGLTRRRTVGKKPGPPASFGPQVLLRAAAAILGLLVLTASQAQNPAPSTPVTPSSGAADTDPAALAALRKRYQLFLANAGKPAMDRWVAALEALEKQRIASGDFDGAARVRSKIASLQGGTAASAGTSATVAASARIPTVLRPAQARNSSGVEFTGAGKLTPRFKKNGSSMEWELTNVQPGYYEVRLTFGTFGPADETGVPDPRWTPEAVPAPASGAASGQNLPVFQPSADRGGGVIEFRRVSSLGAGPLMLRRTIRPTGGWSEFRTISLGKMNLDSRIAKFSLRATECQAMGLMDFRSIEFVPSDASTGSAGNAGTDTVPPLTAGFIPEPGSPAYPRELTRLKEVYQKNFIEQTKPANIKYLKNLTDLEAQISLTKDTDTLALLRQEKKLLERGGDSTVQPAITFDLPVNDSLVATIRGEARLTSQKDYLIRLRPAGGCEIIWKLTKLGIPPGTYNVQVECRMSAGGGGTASLFAQSGGKNDPPAGALDILIPNFVTAGDAQTLTPGKVTIAKGADHLFLRVTALTNSDGSLCDLKRLRLTPVSAP